MKKRIAPLLAVVAVMVLALISTSLAVFAMGTPPSWQMTTAPSAVCTDDDVSFPGVDVNVPVPLVASEYGTLSAPGYPNLGYSEDTSFQGVGTFTFTVFTDPFSLPANTLLTMTITTFNAPSLGGSAVYRSTMTWDCTTGAIISLVNEEIVPTCPNTLLSGSVVGQAPNGAQVFWGPSADQMSAGVVLNPGTYWVMGTDASGEFSKIWLTCESVFWVRSNTLQPSYAAPWNGQALPTRVVG